MSAEFKLYPHLVAVLNGRLLEQECAILIEDRVNQPCRVTIESAFPSDGPEYDARAHLGDTVELLIWKRHFGTAHDPQAAIVLGIKGKVVESTLQQSDANTSVLHRFVVEDSPQTTSIETAA